VIYINILRKREGAEFFVHPHPDPPPSEGEGKIFEIVNIFG
jgi:hypothetical protein